MMNMEKLQLFENKKVRTVWDETSHKWYFSIIDVVAVLTDSLDPAKYWRVLKTRLKKEGDETATNCSTFKMKANDGKMRMTDVADQQSLFRIIQSIPSPKAEPFKQWMARVASLTDIITKTWSGMTTREYKCYKGLKKESLRDNMNNIELALNILAEASTTEISRQRNPKGFPQHAAVAKAGGNTAKVARTQLERE